MNIQITDFNEDEILHKLKHYLPAQASLKDFIHHNTLHAFQNMKFYEGLFKAKIIFGFNTTFSIDEYRKLFFTKRIKEEILDKTISEKFGAEKISKMKNKILNEKYNEIFTPRIGTLRKEWKEKYMLNLDSLVHPKLFRILCSYLDQGISIWRFPVSNMGFLDSIKELENNSMTSFFKSKRVKNFIKNVDIKMQDLLYILVGDELLFEHYIFDQQFAHQGWSGIVSAIEDFPTTLLDTKNISVKELVILEMLLEIDALDSKLGESWQPLGFAINNKPAALFDEVKQTEISDAVKIFQDAFEWSYYDEVLAGIKSQRKHKTILKQKSFQAMFCIDDRECSLRRYIENCDANCETFSTPGFFNVEFFYQPEHGKFYEKLCPAPVTPKYLVKEIDKTEKRGTDVHLSKHSHSLLTGWFVAQTIGFWSAIKLFLNIFRPTMSPASASSFKHMDKFATLQFEHKNENDFENNLQIGFTINEMADRVEGLLKSIGLTENFSRIIYVIGHGSSSVNNPHFAAYDCGACCGRPGSVNARVICAMANKNEVRDILKSRGIDIPETTEFIGALHDTTRDDITFFDENLLNTENKILHKKNENNFSIALDFNAKERSRRFESINTKLTERQIHKKVRRRSISLFEPRPELNHATNTLCIVGPRELSENLFLDRRSFMNSYNYKMDLEGKYLYNILKAVAPVCGGINLEYFFSRVDNFNLGAGTKLPHNVMGLFGVANGTDGDLLPGLPSQMIEVHDPLRLLVIVEHFPETVLSVIQKENNTYEWFINEWIHLVVVHPETHQFFLFGDGKFSEYNPLTQKIESIKNISELVESHQENFPVYILE